jgi:hypothetical protein
MTTKLVQNVIAQICMCSDAGTAPVTAHSPRLYDESGSPKLFDRAKMSRRMACAVRRWPSRGWTGMTEKVQFGKQKIVIPGSC